MCMCVCICVYYFFFLRVPEVMGYGVVTARIAVLLTSVVSNAASKHSLIEVLDKVEQQLQQQHHRQRQRQRQERCE